MDLMLKDKVVWITGASGGIGRALASEFAAEGALLGLHGHQGFEGLSAWTEQQPWRERALCVRGDMGDATAMQSCAEQIVARFGRLDVCAANAGIWPQADEFLPDLSMERLQHTIHVNLVGALFTARAFMGALRDQGPHPAGHGAALTFTGSTAGRFGERGHVDYAAAKAGLIGAMLTLKNEIVAYDPNGRVNVVEPGWTVTHMAKPAMELPGAVERATQSMPLKQLGRASDIARCVVLLSSPYASSHISGESLTVAGGMEGRVLDEIGAIDRSRVMDRLNRD